MKSEIDGSQAKPPQQRQADLKGWVRLGRGIAIGVCGLLLLGVITSPLLVVRWNVAKASNAVTKRDYPRALDFLKHAASQAPDDATVHFHLARCFRHLGDMNSVRKHLESALRLGYPKKAILREEWLAQAQSGQMSEAEPHLSELLQDAGDDGAEICEAYVNGYFLTTRFREAFELLDVWQADFPKDAQPYLFRGRYLQSQNAAKEAVAAYREGLKLEPWRHDLQLNLARCLVALHEHAEAAEILNRLETQTPNDPEVLENLGTCLLQRGQLPESVRFLTRLLEIQPRHAGGRLTLARVYLQEQRHEEALGLLKELAAERPFDIEVRYSHALTLLAAGEKERAAEEFRFVKTAREAMDGARRMMEVVTRKEPGNVDLRYQIGSLLLKYESPESGAGWLRSVLEIDSSHRPTHEALVGYYELLGNRELADQHRRYLQRSTGEQEVETNAN